MNSVFINIYNCVWKPGFLKPSHICSSSSALCGAAGNCSIRSWLFKLAVFTKVVKWVRIEKRGIHTQVTSNDMNPLCVLHRCLFTLSVEPLCLFGPKLLYEPCFCSDKYNIQRCVVNNQQFIKCIYTYVCLYIAN